MTTRRGFIRNTALAAAGLTVAPSLRASKIVAPGDRINVGVIGCNGQGFSDLAAFLENPEVECIALSDIDDSVLERRAGNVEKIRGKKPANLYKDWRKLIDNKDIDVVIVGTPDHWHCIQMVAACEAGKDVYVEKPIGRTIEECNLMVKAAKKYNRVVQVGQWQRSDPHWLEAVNFINSGKLGKIRLVRVFSYQGWCPTIPVLPDEPVPAGVDYDMWLGPAPKRAFNRNRFHFTFRWFWDYAGGLMTDWGVHLIDYILYGMGKSIPASVMAIGGKYAFPDDDMVTPDTMTAVYDFNDFTMIWEHTIGIGLGNWKRPHGMSYIGENGTLVLDRGGWEVFPEKQKIEAVPVQKNVGNGQDLHARNFLDCLQNNTPEKLNAGIEIGRRVALVAQMGNVAYRTGEKVSWDDAKQQFKTETANKLITPVYHNGYKLPV
jgi:predicted dehydrogenase